MTTRLVVVVRDAGNLGSQDGCGARVAQVVETQLLREAARATRRFESRPIGTGTFPRVVRNSSTGSRRFTGMQPRRRGRRAALRD